MITPNNAGAFAPEGKIKNAVWIVVIILVVIIFFAVGGKINTIIKGVTDSFSKLLQTFGLEDSPEDKENTQIINDATRTEAAKGVNSAWSPLFWKQKAGAQIFTQSKTNALVQQIWDSVSYILPDEPEKFVSAIKQCRYKTQVSWLAYNFNLTHTNDLLTWASRHFDTDDQQYQLAVAIKYVNSLPTGF